MKKLRLAIIGQGRSGRDIHGSFLLNSANDKYEVVAVCDAYEHRRKRAAEEFGCTVVEDYRELIKIKDSFDLVVNSTFSNLHYPITKELLENGISVLCEKPFAATYAQCTELIQIARAKGVHLFVFHQSLLTPQVLNVKEVIKSGKLGKLVSLTIKYPGFNHRYDWQTLQYRVAGSLYNTAPHPIGQALDILGWDDTKVAFSHLSNENSVGDADDCDKVILINSDGMFADIEVSSCDAIGKYEFKLCGTNGTMFAGFGEYTIKYINGDFEKPKLVESALMDEDGKPTYCKRAVELTEENGTTTAALVNPTYGKSTGESSYDCSVKNFYDMMYDTVVNGKEPLVSAEMAAEVIRVIEKCHIDNPIEQKYWDN